MIRTFGYDLRSLDENFERFFGNAVKAAERHTSVIPIDVMERNNALRINAAVPGIEPGNVNVSIEDNVLTINAESEHSHVQEGDKLYRREVSFGRFSRSIRLPEGLNQENIDAEFKNGMLTITIPKAEEEKPKVRRIEVRTGNPQPALNVENNN